MAFVQLDGFNASQRNMYTQTLKGILAFLRSIKKSMNGEKKREEGTKVEGKRVLLL
jgi:hypothetical protein